VSDICNVNTHFIVAIRKDLAMKGIIDIFTSDWVDTANAIFSQVESAINLLLGDFPVGSIRREAL
jgi:hypothetical protein